MTRTRRLAVVVFIAAAFVALTAAPAFAHASLESTDPVAGSVLTTPPSAVEMQFSESVTVSLGGVRVFDSDGNRVATDPPEKPTASRVRVGLRGTLADGSYVVTWRVTSADTHPVQGAFTFQVGNSTAATSRDIGALTDRLLADQGGVKAVGVAWGVARWLAFTGIALLVGGVVFGVVLWPRARDLRATRQIITGAWMVLTVATFVGFALQGPYDAGLGLRDALDPALWNDIAVTRFGAVWLGRLVLLAVAFVLLRWWFGHRPAAEHPLPRWWVVTAAVVATGLVTSPALAGHSAVGDLHFLATAASAVHVAAMSVWLGGLVMMGAVAVRGPDIDGQRAVVTRFSRIATWCVVALLATGAFQSWREVRNLQGLRDSDFGHILVVKLVVFALMAVFAVFSRDFVVRLFGRAPVRAPRVPVGSGAAVDTDPEGAPDEDLSPAELAELEELEEEERRREWRGLRRSIWAEAVFGVAVLAVTAVLVNSTPAANAALAGAQPAGVTMRSAQVVVDVTIAPATAGPNDVHVSTFTKAGAPMDVADLSVTLDLPSKGIAPITVPLRKLGPGHYLSPGFVVPLAGEWRATAKARLTDVDEVTLTGKIPIR